MQRAPRILFFAAAAGLLSCGAFILSYFGVHEISRHAPTAPFLALALLASVPLLARVGRWAIGPRGPIAAALSMALLSPMIALGVAHELAEPLIYANPPMCGTPRVMLEMSVPPAMLAAGAMGGLLAAVLCSRGGSRNDRFVRTLVTAFGTLAALLVAAAIVRAARYPDTDRYASTLPVIAELRAASGTPTPAMVDLQRRPNSAPIDELRERVDVYDDEVDGVIVRRACREKDCRVELVPRGTPKDQVTFDPREDVSRAAFITVQRDPGRSVWFVGPRDRRPFVGPKLQRVNVRARDVARSVSPPLGWILGAAAGLALAGTAFALRRRTTRHRAAIAEGRAGMLEPSGLVTTAGDDHPLRAAPGQPLEVGPVVVLPGSVAPGGVYRGDALLVGARVACGAREDLLAAADAKIAHLDALALAALALCSAPLVISAMVGIVI